MPIDAVFKYTDAYEWMPRVAKSTLPPLIVACAITGGVQGKEANINLPETAEEQADQAYEAYKAGATMIHIHARDPQAYYTSSGKSEVYYNVNKKIRERCPDVIINNTTGGSAGMTLEERMKCLDARPEVASLNMGPEMYRFRIKERKAPIQHPRPEFFEEGLIHASFKQLEDFNRTMKERGVKPELEFYNGSNFYAMQNLIDKGLVVPPYLCQFVMGSQSALFPTPENLLRMVDELPGNCIWEAIGTGPFQLPMNVMGIILGGHVRVGMEDNVYLSRGKLLTSNREAVERIVRVCHDLNREVATPAQAREMMGLSATPSVYP